MKPCHIRTRIVFVVYSESYFQLARPNYSRSQPIGDIVFESGTSNIKGSSELTKLGLLANKLRASAIQRRDTVVNTSHRSVYPGSNIAQMLHRTLSHIKLNQASHLCRLDA